MNSLRELLPNILGKLAHESQSPERLKTVWERVVGPRVAERAKLVSLQHGVLRIAVQDTNWARELKKESRSIKDRLNSALNHSGVRGIEFFVP
jgi:predicted nucleic acid-binding Zn ribbon protein